MSGSERLQKNLVLLRNCAGWTASDLGDRLGVSRQTVGSFEKEGYSLSRMQYLAIHKVFEDEISRSCDEEDCMLRVLLDSLVDHPEAYASGVRQEIRANAALFAPAIMKKPEDRRTVARAWASVLGPSAFSAAEPRRQEDPAFREDHSEDL